MPHWKGFSKHLRTFIREMRSEGFNADMSFYMKCLAFIATNWPPIDNFSRSVVKGEFSRAQLERHWKSTKKSIKKLNTLLRRNNIDRTELITTRNAMVPMVYAIAKDKKNKITDDLFIRWLVFSMVGGHYTRQTESILRRDLYFLTNSLPAIENGFHKLYRNMIKKDKIPSTIFYPEDFEGTPAKIHICC